MGTRILSLSDFDYTLPSELIAQQPLAKRDQSRLFIRHQDGRSQHMHFFQLADHLPSHSILIVNDSRVFASRLIGRLKTGGKVEVFLLEKPKESSCCDENSNSPSAFLSETCQVEALAKPMRKLRPGTELHFSNGVIGSVIDKNFDECSPSLTMQFNLSAIALMDWMDQNGYIPLPPYIHRGSAEVARNSPDKSTYQTVYANEQGSVAAPTAGLHFTPELLERLQERNIQIVPITLHVGAGTFLPVKEDDVSKHKMHKELYFISRQSCEKLIAAKREGKVIVGVGTTSFRCVESALSKAEQNGCDLMELAGNWHETDLFVRPVYDSDRYKSSLFSGLITNFHQPESTLFMLIAGLIGFDACHEHYQTAIRERYRFFSYGDSNLLWF
ncbi:MAG: tRNA preQ1(34) S-adenosylmethionine ribosyltransferase-isomerase QueA [Bdellovibrionota bacterium]